MSVTTARTNTRKYTVLKRDTKPAKKLCNAHASLIIPSLDGIPRFIVPDTLKMSHPRVMQGLAKVFLHVCPGIEHKWEKGTEVAQIASFITSGIEESFQRMSGASGDVSINLRQEHSYYRDSQGLGGRPDIVDIEVRFMFNEGPQCIFYKEVVKSVKKTSERMVPLVKDALRLLGEYAYSSDDVRVEAEDWFDMMSDGVEGDDEEIAALKERVKGIKKCGKKGFFVLSAVAKIKILNRLKDRMLKFKPKRDDEIRLIGWLSDLVALVSSRHHLACLNDGSEDSFMNCGMLFPVFYSFDEHDILDFYDERMNGDFEGGCLPEIPLIFSLDLSSNVLPEDALNPFLEDIKHLSLYEKVFKGVPYEKQQLSD